jgi:Ca2+-binding EF-hand superfamily protein
LTQKKNNLLLFIETYTCLTKLSQAEREKMIKSFNLIDSNHNGLIELS